MELKPVHVKYSVHKNSVRFGQNVNYSFLQRYNISRDQNQMMIQSKGSRIKRGKNMYLK